MATYRDDPREITAKYDGKCSHAGCNVPVKRGQRIFYYPKSRAVLGETCGHGADAARRFASECADEAMMGG